MRSNVIFFSLLIFSIHFNNSTAAQLRWQNVDSLYQPLPSSIQVFKSTDSLDGKPNIAYYVIADLKDKNLNFTTDTTLHRRFTPSQFYQRNNHPLLVVNCTFFSFETNRNLNVVIKDGRVVSHNARTTRLPSDTTKIVKVYSSALGINKRGRADVAWIKTDSSRRYARAVQFPYTPWGNWFVRNRPYEQVKHLTPPDPFYNWKVQTAVGGGPVLLQNGQIKITNEVERVFTGKAINDKHPRTAMGYTADNKLIILVIEGRNEKAHGATLTQEAQILKELGCVEALNLDGGGSSCLLVNGKETITPSDKEGQRAIPAVFIIK